MATAEYSNPETGETDVIISGKTKDDFVSFKRIYKDGKPTNSWSSKIVNKSESDFSTMISEAQRLLPKGHRWTESKSISESGLGVWNKAKKYGYIEEKDNDGNVVTTSVTLNEAKKGKTTSKSTDFNNVVVDTKVEAEAKIKDSLYSCSYLYWWRLRLLKSQSRGRRKQSSL